MTGTLTLMQSSKENIFRIWYLNNVFLNLLPKTYFLYLHNNCSKIKKTNKNRKRTKKNQQPQNKPSEKSTE